MVPGNEHGVLIRRERDEIVIPWVDGAHCRRNVRVGHEVCRATQPGNEGFGLFWLDALSKLRIRQGPFKLGKKTRRHDEFESTILPSDQQTRQGPSWR